ncbi:MAG TPA: hypothetical protein DCS93_16945 [Microscillaceae bacterium]|nr:hypothetical protein [Microscillaceae bacterium]
MKTQAQILEAINGLTPKQIEALKVIIEEQHPTPTPVWFSAIVEFKKMHRDAWTIEIESVDQSGELIIDTNFKGRYEECYTGRLYLDKTTCQETKKVTFTLFHFTVKRREFEKLAEVAYTEQEAKNAQWENDLMPEVKQFFHRFNQNQIPR